MTMRKSAFEIGLELDRPADHMPRTIFELGIQQVFDASLIFRARDGQPESLVQGVQRLTRRIGVARETRSLGPATVGVLLRQQLLSSLAQYRLARSGPPQSQQLHHAFLVLFWFHTDQPRPGAFHPLRYFLAAAGKRILLDGPDRVRGIGYRRILQRG